jgi:multiple sugar transport system permease protein/sn-glycerol 3-phosphate transport system permease protein
VSAGATTLRRARRRQAVRRNLTAYAFLAPGLVFFAAFLVLPVAWVVRQSFLEGGVLGPPTFVGLENWTRAIGDPALVRSLRNTLTYTAMVVPVTLALALGLALLLRGVRRGGALVRTVVYLPSLAPVVLAALVWVFMVQPDFGLLNLANRTLGVAPLNLLGDQRLALPTIAGLDVWRGVGFWGVLLLAGLLGVPRELYQAAELDGASPARRFWHVTLPGLRPVLTVSTLLLTVLSMQVFDSVYVLTNGGPDGATQTAVFYIYTSVFETGNPGYGAVLTLILVAVIVVLTLGAARLVRRLAAETA